MMQYLRKKLFDHTINADRVVEQTTDVIDAKIRVVRDGQVAYTPEWEFLQDFHNLGDISDLPEDLQEFRIRMVINDRRYRDLVELLRPETIQNIPQAELNCLELERAHLHHILDVQRVYWSERVEIVSTGERGNLYAKHIPRVRPA